MIYQRADELIGHTPLLQISRLTAKLGLSACLLAKLEYFNVAGSVKDRVAVAMIGDAETKGLLKPGGVIIEPTSGNTGIGLAMAAAVRGYRAIFVMPDTMSVERRQLIAAYGGEVVLTPGAEGMAGTLKRAAELQQTIEGSWIPGQFDNEANPAAHYGSTGPELWADCQGELDAFVACVGTGGTVSGAGRYLKEQKPGLHIAAAEPAASPLLSGGQPGPHKIQGIGANFIPAVLDRSVYDEVITVTNQEAYDFARLAGRVEGVLVGISAGAALAAGCKLAARPEFAHARIAVLCPDGGERYLSSGLYD